MSYLVSALIADAYYLSQIVADELERPTASQLARGLRTLNDLLALQTINKRLIPYFKEYSLTAVAGTQDYFIPRLLETETITFNLSTVRFSMLNQGRKRFFGTPRADGVQSVPFTWHIEREKGGARLYLYYVPADDYPIKIWGKFGLESVAFVEDDEETDLEEIYDLYYIVYLKYALAEMLCANFSLTFPPQAAQILAEIRQQLVDVSPLDLSVTKMSTLTTDTGINWALVNFPGWVP